MGYILLRYHANPLTCNMRLSSDAFALGERPTRRGLSHMGFHAAAANCASSRTPSCAFGAALLQGPTRGGLSHMGFHAAAANCASSRHSILRLWRGPSPRAYARGLSHMGFHAAATNCASSRHSILRLWRGPSPRAYARGLSHMGFHTACRIVSCSIVMLTRSRRYATIVRCVRPWRRARPKAGIDESASFRISS